MRGALSGAGILLLGAGIACAQPRAAPGRFEVSTIAVGKGPGGVALADVDGDGNLDVLTANGESRDVTLLLGDGRGRFAPAPGWPVALPIAPGIVAATAGFVAVTGHDSNDVFVIRTARRPPVVSSFPAIAGTAPHNHGLAIADFNGDGTPDLATSNNNGNSVSVLLGDDRGGFRPARGSPFAVGRAPYPLAVADFNADGKADVATPDVQGGTVTLLLGDGTGSFTPARGSPFRVDPRPFFLLAARVNGDRAPDLVVSHDDIDTMTILVNDGRGGFAASPRVNVGGRTWKTGAADFDGDGRTDLVVGTAPASVSFLSGDGRGNFRRSGAAVAVGRGPWNVAAGDLNRDGKPDVVTTSGEGNSVSVLLAR
ncbi:MAG TPA: VCBS repeat-containing protein [Thermoanaerobaculia bacterium]|nr:VCBS repeat-containing protein [Thermoanaerobaculia bacterium]